MTKWRLEDTCLRRSQLSRTWLAVFLWLAVSSVIILSARAVLATSWGLHESDDVASETVLHDPQTGVDVPEVRYSIAVKVSATRMAGDDIFAAPSQTEEDLLSPVRSRAEADLVRLPMLISATPPLETAYLEVPAGSQERNLNCEYQSAADLASYYGWDISWRDIFLASGRDAGGDPNRGFVGKSIDDPPGSMFPNGYGVYAEPVARGLRRLGIQSSAHQDKDIAWLKDQVSAGRPVVVWATYGMHVRQTVEWQTDDGVIVTGVPYQHTFTVVGYDADSVWLNDPYDGSRQQYSWRTFDTAWGLLERMAMTIDETIPR